MTRPASLDKRPKRSARTGGPSRRLRTSARAVRARDAVRRLRRILSNPVARKVEQPSSDELLDELFDLDDPELEDTLARLSKVASACREEDREILQPED